MEGILHYLGTDRLKVQFCSRCRAPAVPKMGIPVLVCHKSLHQLVQELICLLFDYKVRRLGCLESKQKLLAYTNGSQT